MNQFTNSNLDALRKEINEALAVVAQRNGIEFKTGNIGYTAQSFKLTLECFALGETNTSAAEIEWNQYCRSFDLKKEWFGQEFTSNGNRFKITGIKKWADKFPVIAMKIGTASSYKFQADKVARAFGEPEPKMEISFEMIEPKFRTDV